MPFNGLVRRRLQPLSSAFTSNRILWYFVFSTFATAAAIANACRTYSNFYSIAVYLSRSGRSLLVLANFGFIIALISGRILQKVFFGPLQPREVERLYDQTWMFVTESLLAFTIFRDDFDIPFVIMFGFLLFIKCFHWLMADRVESMDQVPYPGPSTLFHVRLNALFLVLWMVDLVMLFLAIESTLTSGVGGAVLFANEYAILTTHALNSVARYGLSFYEIRRAATRGGANAPPWEHKSMYVFYVELVTDFLKLATYMTFFAVVLSFYGLPLNIIRDVYLTARSFLTRLRALVRYHNATRDMDRRYPNATEAELAAMSDRTCIICRDELVAAPDTQINPQQAGHAPNNAQDANQPRDGPNVTPKKLPCGHIFHFQCLRSWLERQQNCPTCRRTVLETGQDNRSAAQAGQRGARQAGPQQQNNAAPQAPPVPGQQQPPPNNGLGWLGRLLGVALQPPLLPGQFANGPVPPQFVPLAPPGQQPPPPNGAWAAPGQQLPPGYAYVPYYPVQPQIPPQQLQQPPTIRGFYGPGGVFYAWGPEAQNLPQGPQATAQQAQPGARPQQPTQNASVPAAIASPDPDPSTSGADSARGSDIASANASSSTDTGELNRPNPREAAARAALLRFPFGPNAHRRPGESRPDAAAESVSTASETDSDGTLSPPVAQSPIQPLPVQQTGTSTPLAASAAAASPRDQPQVPAYIPLADPGQYTSPPLPPQSRQHVRPAAQAVPRGAYMRDGDLSQALHHHLHAVRAEGRRLRNAPPLRQLPAQMTEEQLRQMDQLTREAIDGRLRVLEEVSETIWRCINELQRLRGGLPAREGEPLSNAQPTLIPDTEEAGSSSADTATVRPTPTQPVNADKGKAVDTAAVTTGVETSSDSDSSSMSSRQSRQADNLD